jgi:hypothetical protein
VCARVKVYMHRTFKLNHDAHTFTHIYRIPTHTH